MTDRKISQFADGGAVQVTDEIATNRAGVNTKVFVGSAAAYDAGDAGDELPTMDIINALLEDFVAESDILDEDDFASNSDTQTATQQSIKVYVDTQVGTKANTSHTHTSSDITDFNEAAQDAVGLMIADTSTIDLTYADSTPELKADLKSNSVTAGYLSASVTNVLFGRSTSGAGAGEEIACTAAGRALIDDADASAQRTTLGLGALAVLNTVGSSQIDADAVTYAKIQNVSATDKILGRSTSGAGDVEEIACTAAGRALIDDADASAQRTTLGLGTLATLSSVGASQLDATLDLTAKTVTVATAALDTNSTAPASTAFYWNNQPPSYRNALINGAMQIAQRGVTFTGINTTTTYTLDRWFAYAGASAAMSVSQQSGIALSGFNFALRAGRPNANTNTTVHAISQIIETAESYKYQGKTCTLSFFVRSGANFSAASSNLAYAVKTGTGSDQGAASLVAATWTGIATVVSGTQAINTTLTRYSVSVPIGATATEIGVIFSYTPVGTAGAADYFEITGVQLEPGPLTPYEYRPLILETDLCERTYEKSYGNTSYPGASTANGAIGCRSSSTTAFEFGATFRTRKRVSPTVTIYSTTGASGNVRDITAGANKAASATGISAGSFTAGTSVAVTDGNLHQFQYVADAELN